MNNAVQKSWRFLASTELAIALFGTICLFAIPGTFGEDRSMYSTPFFKALLVLLCLNLLLCTVRRWKSLSAPVMILHAGVILTLAGCLLTSFGYVATVNVYEGSTVNKVYRWDLHADAPLGMDLAVKRVHREYFPIPVKVGVLKNNEKNALFTLKTGEGFNLGDYRVVADSLEFPAENLKLSVFQQGRPVGSADTAGASNLPPGFPYAFRLVAFKNPSLKRMWVDLELSMDSRMIAEGISQVNSPFTWEGLCFYHVKTDHDANGMPYAGIQIVKDPGRPLVYLGFAVVGAGAVLSSLRRFYGHA